VHRFAADDGEEIRVQVGGSGPPVVLLHEWASSHRVWAPIAHRLEECFTVYRWDARGHFGHGDAHAPIRNPVTLDRMADDLRDLLGHFALDRPTVIGHSMGALTLWAYIGRYGCGALGRIGVIDQSPRLITDEEWKLGIYGDWTPARDAAFIRWMRSDFVGAVLSLIANGLNLPARQRYETAHPSIERLRTYFGMLDSRPLIEVWPTLSHADLRPALFAITVPALLVYGDQSNFYAPPTGPWVRDAIREAELIVYEGADHSPHVAQPERFAVDVRRFVTGVA